MYLIAGLGNPGKQYEATRHNMGFDTVDCLVEKHNIPQGGVKFNAMYGKGIIGGEKAILMKPLSYMNLSGGPIQEMSGYFKIDPHPCWCRCKTERLGSGRFCAGSFFGQ